MTKANKNEIKIDAHHCYVCGNDFNAAGHPEHKKTMHHAIPVFLKPDRNILVPVCEACHRKMNIYNVQSLPKIESWKGLIDNMKQFIRKYEKIIDKYDKAEKDEDKESREEVK